jgi:hypothetical protein
MYKVRIGYSEFFPLTFLLAGLVKLANICINVLLLDDSKERKQEI